MAENDLPEDLSLPVKFRQIPLEALNKGVRKKISLYMNLPGSLNDDIGVTNDYSGLAELVGFTYIEIKNFDLQKSPTEHLLDEWTGRADLSPTVGNLWKFLKDIERYDVLNESWSFVQRDCENYLKIKARFPARKEEPIQDSSITQSSEADHSVDDSVFMTIDDVQGDTRTIYDAFVCYNPEEGDLEFVRTLIEKLEQEAGLKLFVPWRDDLPGASHNTICAKLIEQRCKRMIIILSKKFLQSASCDFQTKFAHSLSPGARSKKMIPILIEQCEVPPILRHITCCDYTKKDLIGWFWTRLAQSLKVRLDPAECGPSDAKSLSSLNLDTGSSQISNWSSSYSSSQSLSSYSSSSSSLSPSMGSVSLSSNSSTSSSALFGSRGAATSGSSQGSNQASHGSNSAPSSKSDDYETIGKFKRLKNKLKPGGSSSSSQNRRPLPPPRDNAKSKTTQQQQEHFC